MDGVCFSEKYKSGMIQGDWAPYVVVFANEPPILSAMSKDRWQIYEIIEGRLETWKEEPFEAESRIRVVDVYKAVDGAVGAAGTGGKV